MTFDSNGNFTAEPQAYWYQVLISQAKELQPSFTWNEGSNISIMKQNEASNYASWDLIIATFLPYMVEQFNKMNLIIQSKDGSSLNGIIRAYQSLSYVKKCIVIRAKKDNPNCYLFIEAMDPESFARIEFSELTEEQKTELLNVGAETHAVTHPRQAYDGMEILDGVGYVNGRIQEKGVQIIINQIATSLLPKIKIRITVKDGYVDALHKITEANNLMQDFIDKCIVIQQMGVDFMKINYACTIKTDDRYYMYDFNFFDATDEVNLIELNFKAVEEFEYLTTPTLGNLEVDYIREDGTVIL